MNALLEQFLSESRESLQGIGERLMQLEVAPDDAELMTALFRTVHTLKGNSGLFDFPEMSRVLHAGEDLMDAVRDGRVQFSRELADRLLDAMDFVGMLCDEIEASDGIGATHAAESARLAESLRALLARVEGGNATETAAADDSTRTVTSPSATAQTAAHTGASNDAEITNDVFALLDGIPVALRADAARRASEGAQYHLIEYTPTHDCFFQGEDPFFQARGTPGVAWRQIVATEAWPPLAELDAYRCILAFHMLSDAPEATLLQHFRYMAENVRITPVPGIALAPRTSTASPLESTAASPTVSSIDVQAQLTTTEQEALAALIAVQRHILTLPIEAPWHLGRLNAVSSALTACLTASGKTSALPALHTATARAVTEKSSAALVRWLDGVSWQSTDATLANIDASSTSVSTPVVSSPSVPSAASTIKPTASSSIGSPAAPVAATTTATTASTPTAGQPDAGTLIGARTTEYAEAKFGRRVDEHAGVAQSLKVDQVKIDRLMNLIGEMVVSKNALPYLAGRAETVFGSREMSREIKAQYAVINRIAEEMQDAIMQVRMMPVSFVFQRFPRLVRDISRKLGKDVNLVLEGEETEADKHIIESLSDPLVHIVRNSLDHGFEQPDVRHAAGKPVVGTLTIRASQAADRVLIEIIDDGKGIDPAVIKRKAYEKGLIDEATLERLSDEDAIDLVFAPGFSTMDAVSDLSGRGVGMDVVRTAVEKVNGTVALESVKGIGTRIRLSLPLSMAVTSVMIVEADGQQFGVPMDTVVETVRVPRADIRTIKQSLATVLRGRIVPLKSIHNLLALAAAPRANAEDELAVLVVTVRDETVGLLVDDFCETAEIILKPMSGVLNGMSSFAGSALMGDGTVLMVLNVKEMLQ